MHSHFIVNKLRLATAFLAVVSLIFNLPIQAQDQDTSKKMDDLRREISFLNSRVCGAGAAQDSAADMRKQTLAADAKALTALLDQQKAKLTGTELGYRCATSSGLTMRKKRWRSRVRLLPARAG